MVEGGRNLWMWIFSSLRNAWVHPVLDNSRVELDIPWVCVLCCFLLCSKNEIIQYPWDLYKSLNIHGKLQKQECQLLETLADFFFPHWRRCVVCGMWE